MQTKRLPLTNQSLYGVVVDNVFTPAECDELIREAETRGFEKALVNVGGGQQVLMTDYRNSSRCIIDSVELAQRIWERIKDYVPSEYRGHPVVELNERLRFLRYDPGDYFLEHRDGCYERPMDHPRAGDRSYITVQVYLNEGFEGGSTRFMHETEDGKDYYDVVPRTGSVLLFQHNLLHSGELLVAKRKYAIRTDVMYAPTRETTDASVASSSGCRTS